MAQPQPVHPARLPRAFSSLRWQRQATSALRQWDLHAHAGRFVELSGDGATASLTVAAAWILQAQQRNEPTAWIAARASGFFPPDFHRTGIDLDALVVIRAPGAAAAAKAADHLLRSGAFALVTLDLGRGSTLSSATQTRLVALAQKHRSTLLCLTRKKPELPSLGSLVSLRATAVSRRTAPGRFEVTLDVLKDKRQGPGWHHAEVCSGPDGLR
jgi:recombination protein RecA